ncbi:MAG: carboxypeptidase regulatory-like domain-containing protein [bacterium]
MKKMVIALTMVMLFIFLLMRHPAFSASIILDWAGRYMNNQNFNIDGVHPNSGVDGDTFEFCIKYVDLQNAAPTTAQVWIDRNRDGDYNDTNERLTMNEWDVNDKIYREPDGKIYTYSTVINYKGYFSVPYKFYFKNSSGTAETEVEYISISPGDNFPRLSWTGELNFQTDGVHQELSGYVFHITYINKAMEDAIVPFRAEVWIDIDDDGNYESGENFTMNSFNQASYKKGRIFEYIYPKAITFSDTKVHSISYYFLFEDYYNGTLAIGAESIVGDPTNQTSNTFSVIPGQTTPPSSAPILYFPQQAPYKDGIGPDNEYKGGTLYTFKVCYLDKEIKEAPGVAQVWIDIDNDEEFSSFEKYNMQFVSQSTSVPGEFTYQLPKALYYSKVKDEYISFKFYFRSRDGRVAIDSKDSSHAGDPTDESINKQSMKSVDAIPTISWPVEADFSSCISINPANGEYTFTIIYKDSDNVAPKGATLYVDSDRDNEYMPYEGYTMKKDPDNQKFSQGVAYSYAMSFDPDMIVKGESYYYRFFFHDGYNCATGEPHKDHFFVFVNNPPTLVYADTNIVINGGSLVKFRVSYQDDENNPPLVKELRIYGYGDGDFANIERIVMQEADPNDHNYMDGKEYITEKRFYYCGVAPDKEEDIIYFRYNFEEKYNLAEDIGAVQPTIIVKKVGTRPELQWWGETGYMDDGAQPDLIETLNGFFKFKISYRDGDNQAPLAMQLWIDTNNNGIYDKSERYGMVPSFTDKNYVSWKGYYYNIWISGLDELRTNTFHYRFYFHDGANIARYPGTDANIYPVMNVSTDDKFIKLNAGKSRPELIWVGGQGYTTDGVEPGTVKAGEPATFKIKYKSSEGMAPQEGQLWLDIDGNGEFDPDEKYTMLPEIDVNENPNYRTGVIYTLNIPVFYNGKNNAKQAINYTYYFFDGYYSAVGEGSGKKVLYVEPRGIIPQIFWGDGTTKGMNFNRESNVVCFKVRYDDKNVAADEMPLMAEVWLDINQDGYFEDDERRQMSLKEGEKWVFIYCITLDNLIVKGFSGADLQYQFKFANTYNYAQGEAAVRSDAFKSPILSWSQADPNFIDKGVYPDMVRSGSIVTFKVVYESDINDLPQIHQVWVWANTDDDHELEIDANIIMMKKTSSSQEQSQSTEYMAQWVSPSKEGGWVNYRFDFNNGYQDAVSNPAYVDTSGAIKGPAQDNQFFLNRPPYIRFEQDPSTFTINPHLSVNDPNFVVVDPNINVIDPNFVYIRHENDGKYIFRVIYADKDNQPPDPNNPPLFYLDETTPIYQSPSLFPLYKGDKKYKDGIIYGTGRINVLYDPGNNGNHTYRFIFHDGYHACELKGSFHVFPYYEVPYLSWPEGDEFDENQAVRRNPNNGSLYHFQITYTDLDADAITQTISIDKLVPQRSLLVDLNNNGSYDLTQEIFQMEEMDSHDKDLILGKVFVKNITYTGKGPLMYRFLFHDGHNIAGGGPSNNTYFNPIIPLLSWTGEVGFKDDGIEALNSDTNFAENFEFRIKYEDSGGNMAQTKQVWIDINGDDEYEDDEKFDMNLTNTAKVAGTNLRISYYSYKLANNKLYYSSERPVTYTFYFTDNNNKIAQAKDATKGDPTKDQFLRSVGSIPLLSFTSSDYPTGVKPAIGKSSDEFSFRVTYIDLDNDKPYKAQVLLYLDANDADPFLIRNLTAINTTNTYNKGKDFITTTAVKLDTDVPSGIFKIIRYRFVFCDYYNMARGTPTAFHTIVLNNHAPQINSNAIKDIFFKVGDRVNIKELVLGATTDQDTEYGDTLTVSYFSAKENKWISGDTLLKITSDDVGYGYELLVKVADLYGKNDTELVHYSVSDKLGLLKGTVHTIVDVGSPIEGAYISVVDINNSDIIIDPNRVHAISDPNGNFEFLVNEGRYTLMVSKPGFEMEIITPILIVAGENTELEQPIFLNPFVGLIKGWVHDMEGRDIGFAKVKATAVSIDKKYRRSVYCTGVDQNNRAYFALYLPNGKYTLIVSGKDYTTINLTNARQGFTVNYVYDPDDPLTYPNPLKNSELGVTLQTKINWNITSYELNKSNDPNSIANETMIIIAQQGVIKPDIAKVEVDYSQSPEIIGGIDYAHSKQIQDDTYTVPHYQILYKDYAGKKTGTVRITLKIPAKDNSMYDSSVTYAFDIHPDTTPQETVTNLPVIRLTTQNSLDSYLGGITGFDSKALGQYFDATYIKILAEVIADTGKTVRLARGPQTDRRQISYEYTIDILGENDLPESAALLFDEEDYVTIYMQVDPNVWRSGHLPDVEIRYYDDLASITWKTEGIDPTVKKIDKRTISFNTKHLSTFAAFSVIPTNLEAVSRPDRAIHLSWEDNAMKEKGYRLQRSINTGDSFVNPVVITLNDPNRTEYTDDENIEEGVEYKYRVQALTQSGATSYSNTVAITYSSERGKDDSGIECFIMSLRK